MPSFPPTVWLDDRILGKRGRKYKIVDIEKILGHYNIRPTQSTPRKPHLLQQLSLLAHTHHLTRIDRWRITKPSRIHTSTKLPELANHQKPPRTIIPQRTKCQACLEELDSKKFPRRRITKACEHEALICRSCLRFSIDLQIGEKRQWNMLKCPLCPQKLSFETVKKYATEQFFEEYDHRATIHVLSSMPDFRLCANPECGSGQFHDMDEELPIWTCQKCDTKMCFKHEVEWHEGLACEEYEETIGKKRLEENELSLRLLEETTKICPGDGCGVHVEKVDGCDHMTCDRCSHEFCWRCLNPYQEILEQGSEGHKETCAYHNELLPSNALLDPEGYLDEEGNILPYGMHGSDDEVDMVEEWNGIEGEGEERESVLVPEEEQEAIDAALAEQLVQTQREEALRNERERRRFERREVRRATRRLRRRTRRVSAER